MGSIAYEFSPDYSWPLPEFVERRCYRRCRFPVGYEQFSIDERNLSQNDVFILINHRYFLRDDFLPLGLLIDALRSAAAKSISLIFNYLPHCRCMNRGAGESLGMAVFCRFLNVLPVDRYIFFDLHDESALAFLQKPAAIFSTLSLWERHIRALKTIDLLISPDLGRRKMLEKLGEKLSLPVIVLDKRSPKGFLSAADGEKIAGRQIFLLDDEVVSGKTLATAIDHLRAAFAIHIGLIYHLAPAEITTKFLKISNLKSLATSDLIPISQAEGIGILPIFSELLASIFSS